MSKLPYVITSVLVLSVPVFAQQPDAQARDAECGCCNMIQDGGSMMGQDPQQAGQDDGE